MEYRCSRVAGAVHSAGNILFAPKEDVLFSAIGNRVGFVDLERNAANAVGNFEARKDVDRLALTSDGVLLVAIDVDGRLSAINVPRRTVLHRLHLKARCLDAAFSHDDGALAVTHKRLAQLWLAPARRRRELAPFTKLATFGGATRETTCLRWSPDSKLLAVGADDATIRVYVVPLYHHSRGADDNDDDDDDDEKEGKLRAFKLAAHKDRVVAAFWLDGASAPTVLSCGRDCVAAIWRLRPRAEVVDIPTDRDELFKLEQKHFLWGDANDGGRGVDAKLAAADASGSVVVAAFTSGVFAIYEVSAEDATYFECVHRLSVARGEIDAVALDRTRGEWIALASRRFGQLAVWEWKSETFVLKQQGHDHEATCVAWSRDGRTFASGGMDNRLKLWSDQTGFCFATFEDHSAPIAAVCFAKNVVFSASYDGTVRAYDLARYRNFRTLRAPQAAGVSTAGAALVSLAVDADAEIACAGSNEPFEIYVWSVRTGKLLDALASHEGPVSCLSFNPRDGALASGSWDATVRLWAVERNQLAETLEHPSEVLAIAYRHDGKELCAATLEGSIHVWEAHDGRLVAVIDAKRDLAFDARGFGRANDSNPGTSRCFDALSYSVDGRCVLAGGRSRFVCVYAVRQKVLLKKFRVSSRREAEEDDDDDDRREDRRLFEAHDDEDDDEALPGAKRAKLSGPKLARETTRVAAVSFSPTSRAFVAVTPGAILVYSLVDDATFAPFDVDETVTPQAALDALHSKDPSRALVMALQLADDTLLNTVVASVLPDDLDLVIKGLPPRRAPTLLKLVANRLDDAQDLEFYLRWALAILKTHGDALRDDAAALRSVQRALLAHSRSLLTLVDDNDFALAYLSRAKTPAQAPSPAAAPIDADPLG
ncbi:hypothetical protein CTAYLR_004824 [Chrysophaeum taylorii]|uniref:Small-subunit processome Utp12 domain-containing protein n=1 Tax=Chrysophaeum taylorii TaxID=2483200 RepID=A0AAD7UPI3_9STRA|nr:hypothetical protein CTAYLR_004824 [Chrysophaeum taylorii]